MGSLGQIFSQHAAIAFDRQLHLSEQLGDSTWSFDMDRGTLSFGRKGLLAIRRRSSPVQILGTESEHSGTWLWGWANERSQIPAPLLQASNELRLLGQREGISELVEPQLDLGVADGHRLSMIASGVIRASGYYRCPYEGGALFVLLMEPSLSPAVSRPVLRITTVFPRFVSSVEVPDHRSAFEGYLGAYGLKVAREGSVLTGSARNGDTVVGRFDEHGRLIGLESRMG